MTLVFGTSLRPECQPLADAAAWAAHRLGTPLRLVHVSEDPRAAVVLGTDEEHLLGAVRSQLEEEAERLRGVTGGEVRPHLAAGAVADSLVSVAEFELATALLVGAPPRGRTVLGRTAERAARKSSVPVMTLREPERLMAWLRGKRPLRVLVGADLGRSSQAARAFGAKLAELGPCETEVVFVVSPREVHARMGLPAPPDQHTLDAQAEAALFRELSQGAPEGEDGVTVRVVPARGGADAHLVSWADQGNFDLVVVGQRRHSVLEQFWNGSVARGVVRASPVSVACVPARVTAPTTVFRPPHVIVVGTDLTEAGERALTHALGLATEGGTVHLAHVLSTAGVSASDARQAREQTWHALIRASGGEGSERGGCPVEHHVLEGSPARQLLGLAQRVGADLIVLAARTRPALSRALIGSVAQEISERSPVPVLLVPLPRG
jgi:nucleotide-binding universal stress UspA family protein